MGAPWKFLLKLVYLRSWLGMDTAFGIGFAIGAVMQGYAFGVLLGVACAGLGVPALLWIVGNAMRHQKISGERHRLLRDASRRLGV